MMANLAKLTVVLGMRCRSDRVLGARRVGR